MKLTFLHLTVILLWPISLYAQSVGHWRFDAITVREINATKWVVSDYLYEHMRVYQVGEQGFKHEDPYVFVIDTFSYISEPDRELIFTYKCLPEGHTLYPKSLEITGDKGLLLTFFIGFWNTTVKKPTDNTYIAKREFTSETIKLFPDKITVVPRK